MPQTNSQKMAQAAYTSVHERLQSLNKETRKKYQSVAREFPTLVHSCGLAQAVAFAQAKKEQHKQYLDDLRATLCSASHADLDSEDKFAKATRERPVSAYLRLSRDALNAANWLKRYVEAELEN